MNKELIFTIEAFEGPLDLLLHLIKEKQMDILNLDLNIISKQFLDFIFSAHNLEIDKVSEYLPIAAYLIELQSKQILPVEKEQEINSDYEAEINRQKLISRILEYKKFKEITTFFSDQAQKRQLIFSKEASDFNEFNNKIEPILIKSNAKQLSQAMLNLLKSLKAENKLQVNLKINLISAEERALEIKNMLKSQPNKSFTLESLFQTVNLSLHYFVITFVAILDLANRQFLTILQANKFGPIMIKYRG